MIQQFAEISKQAATKAAFLFDQQVFRMLKRHKLDDLFQDYVKTHDGVDPEALEKRGYMLIHDTETIESEDGTKKEIYHIVKLVKIIDDAKFVMSFDMDISAMHMKEPKS